MFDYFKSLNDILEAIIWGSIIVGILGIIIVIAIKILKSEKVIIGKSGIELDDVSTIEANNKIIEEVKNEIK